MNQFHEHFNGHLDEMAGLLYLERELDDASANDVSAHLASCPACDSLLRALDSENIWLRESLDAQDERMPAHLLVAPASDTAHWGWIAAFGLSIGGAYTLWTDVVEPWFNQASQAGFTQGNLLTMLFFTGAFWKGWDAMRSFTEFLAVATVGTVAIWLLRKRLQRFVTIASVMGAVVCALALPPAARAADVEHGNPSYTLPAGQEVKGDLIVTASRTRIDGDVDGDLIVWSQRVIVNGHVKGDILGMAQQISVYGPVDGNVRVWCQEFGLHSTVAKNLMAWAQTTELDEQSIVGGSMMLFSSTSELDGHISGDLLALAGDLDVEGKLGSDATIRADRLTIGPTAEIEGRTKFTGRRQPNISSSAKLGSPIQIITPKRAPNYTQVRYYWHQVLLWGVSFLFGLALLLLAPAFFFDIVQSSKRIGPSIGFGALFLFATPVAAIIVCATIVGLSVGISTLLLYAIALYSAHVFVGAWLGEKLLGAEVGAGPAIGRLALGLAVLSLIRMIPFAGGLIGFVAVLWGLGALILTIHRHVRPHAVTVV